MAFDLNQDLAAMNAEGNQEVTVFDPGDMIVMTEGSRAVIDMLRYDSSALPIHIQALQELSQEQVEIGYNDYEGSEPIAFKLLANKEEKVLGMRIYQHDAFRGMDKLWHADGYYQIQILLDRRNEDGQHIVVKSSSSSLLMHVVNIIKSKGWYYFQTPQTYLFKLGGKNQHILFNKTLSPAAEKGKK